jgi:hypothetical protein
MQTREPADSPCSPALPWHPHGVGPAPVHPTAASAGNRYTCREIGSFAKAQELLRQGHTYQDKDGDGVACESLQ